MDYLRVKNWEGFQHYKDRLPPWIKLHRELLTDYEFCHLPDETKGHLLMTWLLASQMDGRIPDDAKWVAARIGANKPVNLDALIKSGWLIRDTEDDAVKEKWPSRYVSEELRSAVIARDGGACVFCGSGENLEIDHKKPVSKGGQSVYENLQTLCRPCNRRKRTKSAEQVATQTQQTPADLRSVETETYKTTEAETDKPPGTLAPPDWLPQPAWQEFVAYRKQQKGWTTKAETLLLRELGKLRDAGHDPTAVIEQSIANGWKGLFPLRGGRSEVRDELAARKLQGARNMDVLTGKVADGRERVIFAERVDSAAVFTLPSGVREPGGDDVEGCGPGGSARAMGG